MQHSLSICPSQDIRRALPAAKQDHPNRLKVLFWKTQRQSIDSIRRFYNIDKNLIMRRRGKGSQKRLELWCPTRTFAYRLLCEAKRKARRKDGHISIGTTFHDRSKQKTVKQSGALVEDSNSKLVVMHWNARSLRLKVDELKKAMEEEKAKIVCIQEASLPEDSKYHPRFREYQLFNVPRIDRGGGGLVTLIHNSITVKGEEVFRNDCLEFGKYNLQVNNDLSFSLINVYIPDQRVHEEDLDRLACDDRNVLWVGDFNSKHGSWNKGPCNRNGPMLYRWLLNNSQILINKPYIPTFQSASTNTLSTLDLSIASPLLRKNISNWRVGDDLGSDHFPVFFEIDVGRTLNPNRSAVHSGFRLSKANWDLFKKTTEELSEVNERSASYLQSAIITAAKQAIPTKSGNDSNKKMNTWWCKEIETLRKNRIMARKKWKKLKSSDSRVTYNRCNALLRKAIISAKRRSWRSFVGSMNVNTPSSTVWKRFRAINGESLRKVAAITNTGGELLTDDVQKAEEFGRFYSARSGRKIPWPKRLTPHEQMLTCRSDLLCYCDDLDDKAILMSELEYCLADLKSAAPGDDNIHNEMLTHCSGRMKELMLSTFNSIWDSGEIPQNWRTSKVIPLPKPGKDKSRIASYRPIALTSCLGKLMERIVCKRLSWRLESGNMLADTQFGFRRHRSTTDALLYFTSEIYKGFERKHCTVAVMVDFEAAFDKIPHKSIVLQCMKLGIKGKMLKFIKNFLCDRLVVVSVNGADSSSFRMENGIPQGGIICPLLFNIALHDMAKDFPREVRSMTFADDETIWVTSSDGVEASLRMQEALDALSNWCSKWSLSISVDKTECTLFTRRNNQATFIPELTINGKALRFNKNPKLLGVVMDPKLRWGSHVNYVTESCSSRLNALKAVASRNWGADTPTLRMFYQTYIRSKTTYACEVWGSAAKTHLKKIEAIQAAAIRLCLGCTRTTPVAAMETELDIEPIPVFIDSQIWSKFLTTAARGSSYPLRVILNTKCRVKQSFCHKINSLMELMPGYTTPEQIPTFYEEPPNDWPEMIINLQLPHGGNKGDHREVLKAETLEMIRTQYDGYIKIFTDGSLDKELGISGAGYYNESNGDRFFIPANSSSSMDAELLGINAALSGCLGMMAKSKICILSDSKSALQSLAHPSTGPYSFRIAEIRRLIKKINCDGNEVCLQWIPAHVGIPGNEEADAIAKQASRMKPTNKEQHSLLHCKNAGKKYFRDAWAARWEAEATGRHLFHLQNKLASADNYRDIKRQVATFAARARTGHLVTEAYLYRFNLAESPLCALCDEEQDETIEHILRDCTYPIPARDHMRVELEKWQDFLLNRGLWSLAFRIYSGHRAIGYT